MFNPVEPRLLATANSKEGVGLWDIRKPRRCDPLPDVRGTLPIGHSDRSAHQPEDLDAVPPGIYFEILLPGFTSLEERGENY